MSHLYQLKYSKDIPYCLSRKRRLRYSSQWERKPDRQNCVDAAHVPAFPLTLQKSDARAGKCKDIEVEFGFLFEL